MKIIRNLNLCPHSFFENTAASALQQSSVVGAEKKMHKLQKPKILTT